MGQYGALGYAIDHGWSAPRILDHFYGGTSAARLSTNPIQRVFLQSRSGLPVVVYQEQGTMRTSADGYAQTYRALRIEYLDATRFQVSSGSSCAGPWTAWEAPVTAAELTVRPPVAQTDDRSQLLSLCESAGRRTYHDELLAVHALGTIQTVNQVDTESYLRSVVPAESPASWADLGDGRGAAALESQAVAARSYALAGDTRWGSWATTCDTQYCQVYRGVAFHSDGDAVTGYQFASTDAAVAATAQQVRLFPSGRIARTEFSSSTGGWTAGGDFPAVVDDGDDVTRNPYHTWTVTLTDDVVEAAFDRRQGRDVGDLLDLRVTARDGLGAEGGRVRSIEVRFSGLTLTLTGDQFRLLFGLKSDWYTPALR